MAERSETVLSWNVPNVISIWLMMALLWVVLGVGSHMLFRRGKAPTATTKSGDFAQAA